MMLSPYTTALFMVLVSLATAALTSHHKVRHKHNLLNLRSNDINEIRDAFDEYQIVLAKTRGKGKLEEFPLVKEVKLNDEYDDEIDNNLKLVQKLPKRSEHLNKILARHSKTTLSPQRLHLRSSYEQQISPHASLPGEYFPRNKRVHATRTTTPRATTTLKSIENYDDEYDDDDNDTTNRRLNDDAQAGSARFGRDNSDSQLAEGESLTDFKMKTLGTREDVRNSFQQYRNLTKDIKHNIDQNIRRLRDEGLCRWPNKKVIAMPLFPSKSYHPRKYVLYRCSDDTACCTSNEKTCVVKKFEELTLWFNVRYVGFNDVESLKVLNHTECECVYKDQLESAPPTRLPYHWPMPTISTSTKPPACKCPSFFEASIDDGQCGCICREGNVDCRQRYEGKEGFNISDQRCVINNICVQPHCAHGTYSNGRCPDRNDKINKGFQGTKTTRGSR